MQASEELCCLESIIDSFPKAFHSGSQETLLCVFALADCHTTSIEPPTAAHAVCLVSLHITHRFIETFRVNTFSAVQGSMGLHFLKLEN